MWFGVSSCRFCSNYLVVSSVPNMGFNVRRLMAVISVWLLCTGWLARADSRQKRFLIFPRSAPTRMQLITGFGIPVDLELESLTVGYVFKAEYFLPWNVSALYNWIDEPFKPYPIPAEGKRRRRRQVDYEKSETYNVEAQELPAEDAYKVSGEDAAFNVLKQESRQERAWYDEADADDLDENQNRYTVDDIRLKSPQNLAHSRYTLYKGLEKLASMSGVPGRACLLRSICETAEAPFTYSNGVLGELAHLIMTPSSSVDELSEHSDQEYLRAEQLGVAGEPCEQIFRECPTSFLNKFSGIYETLNMYE